MRAVGLVNKFDSSIMKLIQKYCRFTCLDGFMKTVSTLGDIGFIWLMMAAYLFRDWRYESIQLFLSIAACCIVCNIIMKPLFGRSRPFDSSVYGEEDVELLIKEPQDHSFPSGHTMASFTAAATIALLFGGMFGTAAFVLAFLIGWSRLYLFVHHPSDVLGGMIFGTILGSLCTIFGGGLVNELVKLSVLLLGY